MFKRSQKQLEQLVKKLSFWSQELMKIRSELLTLDCNMADMGFISHMDGPVVMPTDHLPLVRLKEKSILLRRTREKIYKNMKAEGVRILDTKTMEVLIEGGPTEGSFLSWSPGELGFFYFRERADIHCKRKPLPSLQHKQVALH